MSGPTTDRWVCTRCFTSNSADLAACPNCGQVRPAAASAPSVPPEAPAPAEAAPPAPVEPSRPPAASEPATAPPPPASGWVAPPPQGAGRNRLTWIGLAICLVGVGFIFVGILSAAQRGETGEITSAGPIAWSDLQAGDCFTYENETAPTVDGVPCAEPHVYEAFWVDEPPDGEYPTNDEFDAFAVDACVPAFEAYVGHDYDTSVWYVGYSGPDENSWQSGDHTVICYLYNSTESPVEGSAAGSAR